MIELFNQVSGYPGAAHYLELPRALAWAVGNANYHHVHHLSARIPNYRLRAAHEEQSIFASTPVVTVRGSIDALRLRLWDEERGSLVRFPAPASGSPAGGARKRRARRRQAEKPNILGLRGCRLSFRLHRMQHRLPKPAWIGRR